MNPIMPLVSVISVFTLIPGIYGAYIKLSARLLQYDQITWKQGFIFGFIVVICSSLMRAALFGFGYSLPIISAIILGLFANWLIGSWFFSSRGANNEGGALGWGRSMKLTGLALVMLGLTAALLIGVPKMLAQRTMP